MRRRLAGLGNNVSLSSGPKRPLLPNLGSQPFTATQKASLDLKARALHNAPPFIHPDLSFFNPPADAMPFTVTPQNGSVPYPQVGAPAIVVISYPVPVGLMAVIRLMSIVHVGGNPPDFTGQVIWRVLQNGAGIRGLNALNAQYGTFANPKTVVLTGVENDILTITVECPEFLPDGITPNPGPPGGSSTAASFDGWTYPLSEAMSPSSGG